MRASSHWLKRFWLLAAGVAVLLPAAWAAGQDNGRTVYDEQLRLRLDEQVAAAREIGLDAGGWFSFAVFNYNDTTVRKTRMLRQYQIRGWASVDVHGVHKGYVRGMLGWDDWNSGRNPSGGISSTWARYTATGPGRSPRWRSRSRWGASMPPSAPALPWPCRWT